MSTLNCWNCGSALTEVLLPLSRRADCPACRAELHCCRMCRHFDPDAPDRCREERAEPPANPDVANVCEWITPRSGLAGAGHAEDRARSALDALFGDASEARAGSDTDSASEADDEDPAAAARRKLDDLFS